MSGNKVTVNGKTFEVPNGNISVINGKIFVNGKEFKGEDIGLKDNYQVVNVVIEGDVDKIDCIGSVEVKGNVYKGIDCGDSVSITGNVDGKISCGGSVSITGEHKGGIDAGGLVSIR
jgi:hypothetical protein